MHQVKPTVNERNGTFCPGRRKFICELCGAAPPCVVMMDFNKDSLVGVLNQNLPKSALGIAIKLQAQVCSSASGFSTTDESQLSLLFQGRVQTHLETKRLCQAGKVH